MDAVESIELHLHPRTADEVLVRCIDAATLERRIVMMKHAALTALSLGLAGLCLLNTGCTATRSHQAVAGAAVPGASESPVALAAFGPAVLPESNQPDVFFLGAGDNLGHAVFHRYVAYVRANSSWQYASGESLTR